MATTDDLRAEIDSVRKDLEALKAQCSENERVATPVAAVEGSEHQAETWRRIGNISGIALAAMILLLVAGKAFLYVSTELFSWSENGEVPWPSEKTTTSGPALTVEEVDQALQSLPIGGLVFDIPSTMELDDSYNIHVLLSPLKTTEELQNEFRQTLSRVNQSEATEITISPEMEVRLTGENFRIVSGNPVTQVVSKSQPTLWQWEVKALRGRGEELHLTLNAILYVHERRVIRSIRTLDKKIDVHVNLERKLRVFLHENWQWLCTVALFPVVAFAWSRFQEARQRRKAYGIPRPAI